MNHQDQEITDVVIVLDCEAIEAIDGAVALFKSAGLTVDSIDYENSVVEGSIDAAKVRDLAKIKNVRYVRPVFSYTADFPAGDPRDKDGPDTEADESED